MFLGIYGAITAAGETSNCLGEIASFEREAQGARLSFLGETHLMNATASIL
jgi:hypothetical protein